MVGMCRHGQQEDIKTYFLPGRPVGDVTVYHQTDTKFTKKLYILRYLASKQFRKYTQIQVFRTKCPGKYFDV
jgi:hypothetical protein